jgi:hypothetical protein
MEAGSAIAYCVFGWAKAYDYLLLVLSRRQLEQDKTPKGLHED